jgi:DNA-binding NarL/FixJ family response regulator
VIEPTPADAIADFLMTGYQLTPRERQVASLLARGCDSKEIAAVLRVSPHTVRDHIKFLFNRLSVHTRGELISKLFTDPARAISTTVSAEIPKLAGLLLVGVLN